MRTLPTKIRKNRFTYTQVSRGKRSCIYSQEVFPDLTCYEVFLIKVKPQQKIIIKGTIVRTIEEREIFPPDIAFGYWAWAYRNYENAIEKFLELEKTDSHD